MEGGANEAAHRALAKEPGSVLLRGVQDMVLTRVILRSLHIRGLRAHEDSNVSFEDGVNVIIGPNGVGKTNILEAIHLCCLSRSFLTSQDQVVLRQGAPFYEVTATIDTERRGPVKVRVAFVPGEGKKVFIGGAPLERLTDIVGRFPVVIFSPEDQRLTAEGPEFRRRFLDNIISQSSPIYLENLLRYRKALSQRNELLQSARRTRRPVDPVVLEALTAGLVDPGAAIIAARLAFVDAFRVHLDRAYQRISDVAERPHLTYEPFSANAPSDPREAFLAQLSRKADRERERGMTLYGPHRHDLDLFLDDLPVRRYASQGQHRTFGMALKLAQYDYLQERGDERPILLLDDVFDNLDPARIEAFLSILASGDIGQSVTTAARREIIHNHIDPAACRTLFVARGGRVGTSAVPEGELPAPENREPAHAPSTAVS